MASQTTVAIAAQQRRDAANMLAAEYPDEYKAILASIPPGTCQAGRYRGALALSRLVRQRHPRYLEILAWLRRPR